MTLADAAIPAAADSLDLATLNANFEKADPQTIVQWACAHFGDQLVMSSSFGAESALLIHMAIQHRPNIRIVFTDTGYLFPETFTFMEQLRQRFSLNVWTFRTQNDPIVYLRKAGEADSTWRQDIDRCCGENKNEPFERAMKQLRPAAWLRGIRRHQSSARVDRQFVEWSPRYGCFAISPLLNWSTKQIFQYMKQHELPYHPLYEHGYLSIGCNPASCTRAVAAGEDPRAGRWAGTGKLECGVNVNDSMDSAKL